MMSQTDTLLASYDCGNNGGWLADDLECAVDEEPWCLTHQLKAWKQYAKDIAHCSTCFEQDNPDSELAHASLGGPQ